VRVRKGFHPDCSSGLSASLGWWLHGFCWPGSISDPRPILVMQTSRAQVLCSEVSRLWALERL